MEKETEQKGKPYVCRSYCHHLNCKIEHEDPDMNKLPETPVANLFFDFQVE